MFGNIRVIKIQIVDFVCVNTNTILFGSGLADVPGDVMPFNMQLLWIWLLFVKLTVVWARAESRPGSWLRSWGTGVGHVHPSHSSHSVIADY